VGASIVGAAVLVLILALTFIFRRTIVRPIKQIVDVCLRVTDGIFDRKVALESRSEIGQLGATVNRMVDGLKERYDLSKFVSSSTLRAVQNRSPASATGVRQPWGRGGD
jgi:adenylate cyclase